MRAPCPVLVVSFLTLIKSEVAQTLEPPLFLPLLVSTKPRPIRQGRWHHHPFLPVWLLHRLLESQLQSQKRSHENEAEALRGEIQNLKEENNRQQQLLAQNLQLPPEARIEASLQHEITRLTNENLVRAWLRRVPRTVTLTQWRWSEENRTLLAEMEKAFAQIVSLTGALSDPLGGSGRYQPAACWALEILKNSRGLFYTSLQNLCHSLPLVIWLLVICLFSCGSQTATEATPASICSRQVGVRAMVCKAVGRTKGGLLVDIGWSSQVIEGREQYASLCIFYERGQ